ncbi:hypothetical protein RYG28_004271 [Providencia rettgeri]|uniref:Uncharacterized protein n=1 Tax=Providencia stuartii TaxID=588 RepID=A0AAI9DBR8_PROST|nr:hypothetical protein [Providencia rettgeri]ELM3939771.1 hypothetical protein [Providencia rettgeri]ELR5112973.1 hypothetical protein [Providencia stuartii]
MTSSASEKKPMTDEELIGFLKDRLMLITSQLATLKLEDYPDQMRVDRAIRISVHAVDEIEDHYTKF